jgi:hypothetical protein
MKVMKFAGLVLIAMLSATRLMAQNEQLNVKLSNPGKPYKLNVTVTIGSITVSAYQGKDVIIAVDYLSDQQKSQPENENGMKRLGKPQDLSITSQERNNEVTVNDQTGKLVNLSIKIPANAASIKLSTVRGDITINNVSTALEVQNTVGSINAFNVSGSVVANTVRGKVLVTFKAIDTKAAMAFSALVGDVDVTFPVNLRANLKVRSDIGQIYSDFDLAEDPLHPKTTKTANDGKYQLTNDDWIYGKVAGGGPEVLLKNSKGNIYVRKVK